MDSKDFDGTIDDFLKGFEKGELFLSTPLSCADRALLRAKLEIGEAEGALSDRERFLLIWYSIEERGTISYEQSLDLSRLKKDPFAKYLIGLCCKRKIRPYLLNYEDAFYNFLNAYKGGVKEAAIELCEAFYYGRGTWKNLNAAFRFASETNTPAGKRYKGMILILKNRVEEGLSLLEEAAGEGDGEAWFRLGEIFLDGERVIKDSRKAYACFEQGADTGERNCLLFAGRMAFLGEGRERNSYAALHYLSRISPNKTGDEIIGDIMMEGSGFKEAEDHYLKAMMQGNIDAGRKYASLLLEEKEEEKRKEGEELLKNVIKNFDKSACLDLFYYYQRNDRPDDASRMLDEALESHELLSYGLALMTGRETRKVLSSLSEDAKTDPRADKLYDEVKKERKRRRKALKGYHKL